MRDEVSYELLLDPDGSYKAAIGADQLALTTYLMPHVWWRYLRGLRRARPGMVTAGLRHAPSVAIVDRAGVVRYRRIGTTLGDYPPMAEVLTALEELAGE